MFLYGFIDNPTANMEPKPIHSLDMISLSCGKYVTVLKGNLASQ